MLKVRRVSVMLAAVCSVSLVVPQAEAATVTGNDDSNAIFGTASQDALTGLDDTDIIFGKGNPNTKKRRGSRRRKPTPDVLSGGDSLDQLFGGTGRDIVDGGATDDQLYDDDGTPGDALRGGQGEDDLFSYDGAKDTLDCGGDAHDDLAVVDQADVVTGCGTVIALLPGVARPVGAIVYLGGTTGNDATLNGSAAADVISGAAGNDAIFGDALNDILIGGPGSDSLTGGADSDLLVDTDGTPGDTINASDNGDQVYTADGAADTINCAGSTATLFVDVEDNTILCNGPVFEGTGVSVDTGF